MPVNQLMIMWSKCDEMDIAMFVFMAELASGTGAGSARDLAP